MSADLKTRCLKELFGDPSDVQCVVSEKTGRTMVKRRSTKQDIVLSTPPMPTRFVKDTGEGDLLGKMEFDAKERIKATFAINLKRGYLREEQLKDDPLLLERQRAFIEVAHDTSAKLLGVVFDEQAGKDFDSIRAKCMEKARNTVSAIVRERLIGKGVAEADATSQALAAVKATSVSSPAYDAAVAAEVLAWARRDFISGGKNPFAKPLGNDTEPLYTKISVWAMEGDKYEAWETANRPTGVTVESLAYSPDNWPAIVRGMLPWRRPTFITYVEAASGEEIPRPVYRDRENYAYSSNGACRIPHSNTLRDSQCRGALLDPEWSPVGGAKWEAMIAITGVLAVFRITDTNYGVTYKPTPYIRVYDRIRRMGNSVPFVGGDAAAVKVLARPLPRDDDDGGDRESEPKRARTSSPREEDDEAAAAAAIAYAVEHGM